MATRQQRYDKLMAISDEELKRLRDSNYPSNQRQFNIGDDRTRLVKEMLEMVDKWEPQSFRDHFDHLIGLLSDSEIQIQQQRELVEASQSAAKAASVSASSAKEANQGRTLHTWLAIISAIAAVASVLVMLLKD